MENKNNNWFGLFLTGLLLAFLLLSVWEISWRVAGFQPVIEDDLGIWAVKRLAVQKEKGSDVVLLGASRMQLDVDPRIVFAETGRKALMLAIDGSSPLPVLADLAENTDFDGLVLCSLLPQWLADAGEDRGRSAKWVRKFHRQKWSSWIETRLSLFLQSHFVFRYPGLLPNELWTNFLAGEMPDPPYAPMRMDRYRPADYSRTDIERLRLARVRRQQEIVDAARPLKEKEFQYRIEQIEGMVGKIRQRGGKVVFLRLPSSGETFDLEEQTWPRNKYWDRFAAKISARTLHFADYPALASFNCPDGSHLGYRDAESFTRFLVKILALQKDA